MTDWIATKDGVEIARGRDWFVAELALSQAINRLRSPAKATLAARLVDSTAGAPVHLTDGEHTCALQPAPTEGAAPAEAGHGAREHSELGGSVCARYWNCPGSVRESRGRPNKETIASREGTAAHELAEICLKSGQDAAEYVGRRINRVEITAEIAANVQVYLDHCRADEFDEDWTEVRFDLAPFGPPAPMFGSCDRASYQAARRLLKIADYKNGWIPVDGGPQMRFYALGAVAALGNDRPVAAVEATIVQPKPNGLASIRTISFDAIDLAEWSVELMERARAALEPDAPLHAGGWCRFCPAEGDCRENARYSLETARLEFGAVDAAALAVIDTRSGPTAGLLPPEPDTLTPEEIGTILDRADEFRAWLKAVSDHAADLIDRGRDVPGWKRVDAYGDRRWRDAEEAETTLSLMEVAPTAPPKLITPAQARNALVALSLRDSGAAWEAAGRPKGQKPTKKAAEDAAREIIRGLTYAPSNGRALVPLSDTRPAIVGAGLEFDALPAEFVETVKTGETPL